MEIPDMAEFIVCDGRGKYSNSVMAHIEQDPNNESRIVVTGLVQGDGVNRNGRKYNSGKETAYAKID